MPTCALEGEGSALTGRELEVLRLIGAGRTTRQISEGLGISQRTVENHKRRIFAKLDVQSQAHAVASAARLGLLSPPGAAGIPGTAAQGAGTTAIPETAAGDAGTTAGDAGTTAGGAGTAAEPRRSARGGDPAAGSVGVRLVLGRPGRLRDRLARALPRSAHGQPHGSPVAVLVDPDPEDWQTAECLGARIVLVCSDGLDEAGVVEAFLRGADALVPESRVPLELAAVVELVGLGGTLIDTTHARLLVELARIQLVPRDRPTLVLTPREREILDSIDRGESVKQTAHVLGISAKTVENLQGRLFRKLGVRNRAQAVAAAHAHGLLPPPRILELQPR